jgi:ABC-type nitrate/sulfonate/bicarbonate transport system ATPase subunit
VLFITHDLDEAIAMSDRVWSFRRAGVAPIGEFVVDLATRDVAEVRDRALHRAHKAIWTSCVRRS